MYGCLLVRLKKQWYLNHDFLSRGVAQFRPVRPWRTWTRILVPPHLMFEVAGRDPASGEMAHFVYILRSRKNGKYYVGQTSNLASRLKEHNAGQVASTRPHCPWELVHHEEFDSRQLAIQRERRIKARKKRAYIDSLINRGVAQPG